MKFEDIRDMDEEPFDTDVLESVYYSDYSDSPFMPNLFANLIFFYFYKFDERYGTRLSRNIDVMQILSFREEDEDTLLWYEEAPALMSDALLESGWSDVWLGVNDESLTDGIEHNQGSKKAVTQFHEKYTSYIEEYFEDDFVKACYLQEEKVAFDATFGLEEGYLGFMWNEKLDRYEKFQEENRELISILCPEEDQYISRLKKAVWKPYIDSYIQDTGNCQGIKYIKILIGCDGGTYNFFDSINPNWICRAVKLGKMLDIALDKIEDFQRHQEEKKKAS